MDIPYHFQKRSVLTLYASGTLLEAFRQALFYEDIVLPFGKEEGCLQCKVDSNVQPDSWQVELQIVGSTQYEAYQIEDDGTLLDNKGVVILELMHFLAQEYDASNIRTAIVHIQGKGQQKIVAFLANSSIQPLIPCAIKDHQGVDRILQYKQPDVFIDPQMSNVHVKEMRADHHIISQAKGINQHARISAFIPFPRNELSRRRFSRVRSINVCVNRNDTLCTILDEAVPVCLVNHELATCEAACLLELLFHKQPILNHHSAFLSCPLNRPEEPNQEEVLQDGLLKLPNFSSIVHCHLNYNQTLTIHQPRFEDGQVSRCISNSLQLVVYERTDIIFFLTGNSLSLIFLKQHPKGVFLQFGKFLTMVYLPILPIMRQILQILPHLVRISQPKSLPCRESKQDPLVRCKVLSENALLQADKHSKSLLIHSKQRLLLQVTMRALQSMRPVLSSPHQITIEVRRVQHLLKERTQHWKP